MGGRVWSNWYSSSENSIHLPSTVSSSFSVLRGVRQGSVLSPLLFLMVMDSLLRDFRWSNIGRAPLWVELLMQMIFVLLPPLLLFCKNKLILSTDLPPPIRIHRKLRFSKSTFLEGSVILNDESIDFVPEAKCLGVWWNHNLSAYKSVNENICKARRAFFVFGKMHAFHGHLNPLSAISIYKTCVLSLWQ